MSSRTATSSQHSNFFLSMWSSQNSNFFLEPQCLPEPQLLPSTAISSFPRPSANVTQAEDEKNRERIDAKNGLENYAYSLRNTINDPQVGDKLESVRCCNLPTFSFNIFFQRNQRLIPSTCFTEANA
eukprot:TRINITY_DN8253_c0_g1_i1.p1 TRINITY_DN8253_c0_g1~~TRINITY_DN8253_c0_g1_i1.p1  ORF type:complete len:127 (-),score=6.31 TRINITY_DN8253_c0_g1_i1:103-483(-)